MLYILNLQQLYNIPLFLQLFHNIILNIDINVQLLYFFCTNSKHELSIQLAYKKVFIPPIIK